jgi:hypothetical protein
MKKVIHKSTDRGYADYGWLKARYSFSFANWYNPDRIQFGKLRVLNDDLIAPGKGFGAHPHENMEIVTIPFEGTVAHKDNTGHEEIIKPNDVQVMSAGSGILHSEYNASKNEYTSLFQIWIFPDKDGHTPRYDQKSFDPALRKNKIHTFVSPEKTDDNLWLNQDAYFSWSDLDENQVIEYSFHNRNNGIYLILIDGIAKAANEVLTRRDALGIWETSSIEITAEEKSSVLIIEVLMS